MKDKPESGRHQFMKTAAIILALFLAGCSSPKPPPSGYDQPWDADNTNTIGTVHQ